ncbi:MAG: transcription-repair coupling factor [Gammaproteobacteria bacterium]|nr:transcription-repair coupling factor [Gammaproteobacteria bacterium]
MQTFADIAELLPSRAGERIAWENLHGAAPGYFAAKAAEQHGGFTLVVANNTAQAQRWLDQIGLFHSGANPLHFPDWETLPYDAFSPHQDIISERLATLSRLPKVRQGVLVVPVTTLMQRLAPKSYIDGHSFALREAERFDLHEERGRLDAAGYLSVDTVRGRGEYAVRGSLMDIFPMGSDNPVRIDLMDDEIDSLRIFDADTQLTIDRVAGIELLPAKEFAFDDASISRFRNRWHATFNVDVRRCSVYQDVSSRIPPSGIEYYLPFFFDAVATLFDYLPANTLVVQAHDMDKAARQFWADVDARHESLGYDVERPIVDPGALFLALDELYAHLNDYPRVILGDTYKHKIQFHTRPLPNLQANARLKNPARALVRFTEDQADRRMLFTAESAGRRELLYEFLTRAGVRPTDFESLADFVAATDRFGIIIAPLDEGLWTDELLIVSESQLFGHRAEDPQKVSGTRVIDPDQVIRNLTELNLGAPVVHIEHGIGRYRGLQTLSIDGHESEFLTLEYAGEAKLYVPVTSLHLITRYAGADAALAPLHRLGSDQWEKAKRRAAEKIVDVAAELLNIYARRATQTSYAFTVPNEDYQRFNSQFPFEVTVDQQRAIDAVIDDLASDKATDRLICGDVGFGKTEVAMRAAFVTVQNDKQVVVLVPTTLLAQQHFDTFRDRFADWPVNIDVVSRLRTEGQVARARERLARGTLDILIGTHKLLSPSFSFKDLGLVVIDEEHRFGVRQKERLRALRAEVDVVALTATPIPRTLNMAISGIRDLSIIATPPARRLSINTFVHEKRHHIIREAISRELMRGGQVFYLHNEVRSIEQAAEKIAEMVPEARIGIGHGQMAKRKLERVMADFYHRQLNVLVCTTIIENGIDIPNANTIIIERADKFGLAQLHQLRGRVGRSHRQAYAYLLTPHPKAMTRDAVKRLEAIAAASELGVGFTLATHDLEIRGAGELLGDEQSGQIESVGFSLYMDLLDRAVQAIREGKTPNLDAPLEHLGHEVNLHCGTLIPASYLPDVHTRLIMYKRIANAKNQDALDSLQVEMIDRFGFLPVPLKQLFRVTSLKLRVNPLGIVRFDLGENGGKVEFGADTSVDPLAIVTIVQKYPNTYRLDSATKLRINRALTDLEDRFRFADELLESFKPRTTKPDFLAANA